MRNAMLSFLSVVFLTSTPAWADIAPAFAAEAEDVCPGDLNGDEVVDSADLATMLGSFGICQGCDEDLNHDGYVDETDIRILASHWGPCASAEDVLTNSGRIAADVSDDADIYGGEVATNDNVFSDVEQGTCEGDLDGNGQIDSVDLAMLLTKYGRCADCEEDLNGDGVVDEEDVDIILDNWGKCAEREETPTHVSRSTAADRGTETDEDLPPQDEPEEAEPQCPGDLDGNGTIDSSDLAIMLSRYGRCSDCKADLTGDGAVDQDDIDLLMTLWGDCDAASPSNSSPSGRSQPGSLSGG